MTVGRHINPKSLRFKAKMSNKAKRIEIFRFCTAAASKLLGVNEALYLCPICGKGYSEESAVSGELTLEHVPPRSMGGKGLLLTCKDCNSNAGHKINHHIKNQLDLERFTPIILGQSDIKKTSGDIHINGNKFPVTFQSKAECTEIRLIGKANNPKKVNRLKEYMAALSANGNSDGVEFKISKTVKLDTRYLKIAFLKYGFLLITALLGYTYAFDRRLSVVREQILNPENDLLDTSFWMEPGKDQPFPKRRIILVSDPLPLFLVTFDKGVVILPNPSSPMGLYGIIRKKWEQGQAVNFTGKDIEWPEKALMVLDNQINL
jgi:hypothetical protein